MNFILTKKDIIGLNMEFESGNLNNGASLDYALDSARQTGNWTRALAFISRAILIDHVFEEGNKRTAALLVKAYAEYEGFGTYDDRVVKMIKEIILRNITSVDRIEEMIKDGIKKLQ